MTAGTWMLVAVALSASPAGEWARRVCPERPPADDSNLAMKEAEARRGECLRREMNRALDAILLPLKKAQHASFRPWMQVQADFNRWQARACNLSEQLNWLSLQEGVMYSGTMSGYAFMGCEQRLLAERGWFAARLHAGARAEVVAAQQAAREEGLQAQQRLQQVAARVRALGRRKEVPQVELGVPLGAEGVEEVLGKLAEVQEGAARVAAAQCRLSFPEDAACPERMRLALLAAVGTATYGEE